ncbi:hypothetical protein KUCAC02_027448, partial [Chaenocephalus aceratus]
QQEEAVCGWKNMPTEGRWGGGGGRARPTPHHGTKAGVNSIQGTATPGLPSLPSLFFPHFYSLPFPRATLSRRPHKKQQTWSQVQRGRTGGPLNDYICSSRSGPVGEGKGFLWRDLSLSPRLHHLQSMPLRAERNAPYTSGVQAGDRVVAGWR